MQPDYEMMNTYENTISDFIIIIYFSPISFSRSAKIGTFLKIEFYFNLNNMALFLGPFWLCLYFPAAQLHHRYIDYFLPQLKSIHCTSS